VVALALAVVLALALGGSAIWIVQRDSDDGPSEWDPRVAPIARTVERLRGLDFKHPVEVEFLSDAEFDEFISSAPRPSDEDIATAEATGEDLIAEYRALGITDSPIDVLTDVPPFTGIEGLRGLYLSQPERVLLRSSDEGVLGDALLAHELTHVLQDQYFGLERLARRISSTGEALGLQALIEGDANGVMRAYVAGLDEREREQYFAEEHQFLDTIDTGGLPDFLVAAGFLPYAVGSWVVASIRAEGGAEALADAFRDPPALGLQLLDPTQYLVGYRELNVDPPDLAPDETAIETDEPVFGMTLLYWTLASRLDPVRALHIADAWGGAARSPFQRADDVVCTRVRVVGRDTDGTMLLEEGLREWAAAMTPGAVTVDQVDDDGVVFTACDTGAAAQPPATLPGAALSLAVLRDALIAGALENEASTEAAKCAADIVVGDDVLTADILASQAGSLNIPPPQILEAADSRLPDALAACGSA
jgi:hypothetical protein